jgi:hypothetical protein
MNEDSPENHSNPTRRKNSVNEGAAPSTLPKDFDHKDHGWSWLGEESPLYGSKTESEWILEKLCARLEEDLRRNRQNKKESAASRDVLG